MRHRHPRGFGRPSHEDHVDGGHHRHPGPHHHHDEPGHEHGHGRHRGHHRHGRRGGRMFDYGDLRLLLLAMIAESPRHGYELIKAIEDRLGGAYSPSPGVIYPTLSWLDDMGYAAIDTQNGESTRKRYRITPEGEAFLAANRAVVDALLARVGDSDGRPSIPAPVIRAMENLKLAMRLRLRSGALDDKAAEAIATALDEATRTIEKS